MRDMSTVNLFSTAELAGVLLGKGLMKTKARMGLTQDGANALGRMMGLVIRYRAEWQEYRVRAFDASTREYVVYNTNDAIDAVLTGAHMVSHSTLPMHLGHTGHSKPNAGVTLTPACSSAWYVEYLDCGHKGLSLFDRFNFEYSPAFGHRKGVQ